MDFMFLAEFDKEWLVSVAGGNSVVSLYSNNALWDS